MRSGLRFLRDLGGMSQTTRLKRFSETTLQLALTAQVTVDQINNYFKEKEGGLQTGCFQELNKMMCMNASFFKVGKVFAFSKIWIREDGTSRLLYTV